MTDGTNTQSLRNIATNCMDRTSSLTGAGEIERAQKLFRAALHLEAAAREIDQANAAAVAQRIVAAAISKTFQEATNAG